MKKYSCRISEHNMTEKETLERLLTKQRAGKEKG